MGLNGVELIQARGGPARARPLSTARGPGRTLPPPSSAPRPPALCLGKPQTPRATSSASSCSVLPGAPAGRGAAAMPCSVQQAGPPPACAAWRAWRVRGGPRAGLLDRADDRAAVRPAGLQRQRQVQLPAVPGGAGGAQAPSAPAPLRCVAPTSSWPLSKGPRMVTAAPAAQCMPWRVRLPSYLTQRPAHAGQHSGAAAENRRPRAAALKTRASRGQPDALNASTCTPAALAPRGSQVWFK